MASACMEEESLINTKRASVKAMKQLNQPPMHTQGHASIGVKTKVYISFKKVEAPTIPDYLLWKKVFK